MLKKYGRLIVLFVILFITMEVTFIINRLIDGNLDQQQNDKTIERLQETVANSGAKEKGLNELQAIWEFELKLVRDEFPKDNEILFEYVDKTTWDNEFTQLVEEVNTSYLTNQEILDKVKSIIPDKFEKDVFEDYLLSIEMLDKDLYNESSAVE